jgi:hypothetical protein
VALPYCGDSGQITVDLTVAGNAQDQAFLYKICSWYFQCHFYWVEHSIDGQVALSSTKSELEF